MPEYINRLSGVPEIKFLRNLDGVYYKDFIKELNIDCPTLAINILVPIINIFLVLIMQYYISTNNFISTLLIVPFSFLVSFWKISFVLHFHEGAHYNLHNKKQINDLICNIFLTPFTGMWVKDYRVNHWKHHRFLGLPNDTEISYHKPISGHQLFESLTGLYLLKTIKRYFLNFKKNDAGKGSNLLSSLLIAGISQLLITLIIFEFVTIYAAISWLLSIFIFDPFLQNLRQILEHRSYSAKENIDYSKIDHGPVNRIFGNDFISRYFGAAGFNNHLLHHLDPTISYTSFGEFYNYLNTTSLAEYLNKHRTTYYKTFKYFLKNEYH
jgi:fatty acid desaturase